MKQLMLLVLSAVILLAEVSCQNGGGPMEVIIEGNKSFPHFLVGTWKADKYGWEIVFEPDGRISSAVISHGRIRLKPGRTTTVAMKKGGKGIFEPGQWLVHYIPAARELTVQISLKYFHAELGDDVLEGRVRDMFVGQISENAKVWQVDWVSFPQYTAHTAEYPDYELPTDLEYGISKALAFEKVSP